MWHDDSALEGPDARPPTLVDLAPCDPQKPWSRYLLRAYVPVLRLPWGNISGLVHSEV